MIYKYVFWGVDPSTTNINKRNGAQISSMDAPTFISTFSGYTLEDTDVNCDCASPETWLVFTTTTPGSYSVTVGNDTVVGAIFGPIPPRRPS